MSIVLNRIVWRTAAAAALVSVIVATRTWTPVVNAHDWYPIECCRGLDCAEVEYATYANTPSSDRDLPILSVTTKHGTAIVPSNFPRRESPDEKMHACMSPDKRGMRLICLFLPPPS